MLKKIGIFYTVLCCFFSANAQLQNNVVSGPWAGNIELRNATIWAEVTPQAKNVAVKYWAEGTPATNAKKVAYKGTLGNDFNPLKIELNGLNPNTFYNYTLVVDGKDVTTKYATKFVTKELWQFRKPAPDFAFLSGSCSYINEPAVDRPGKPYGGDSSIFETMANTPASFMLWLGDNWYTREVDFYTNWGLQYRASRDRSAPFLQKFWASMPHYAIWDDHDYGPNDSDGSYILKNESREVFKNYWCNPTYGFDGKGIYTKFSYSDVDFFMLDDRFFRNADNLPDSINGQPNPDKKMYGDAQLAWLQDALVNSQATFKIIATGSQVLNPISPYDVVRAFPVDYQKLLGTIAKYKINGVLFFTGDRHHSEIIKVDRPGTYPLYDITVSPLTSGTHKFSGPEKNNPYRIYGLDEKQNFGKITVSGKKNERRLSIQFLGIKGENLGGWFVDESDLKTPKK
jgi:alkaline phosphatase D